MTEQNPWEILSSISSLIQTVVISVALYYAWKEVKNTSDDRNVALLLSIHENFSSDEARFNRWYVYNRLPNSTSDFTSEDYRVANATWRLMDFLGVLTNNNFIDQNLVYKLHSEKVVKLWEKLESHINNYRDVRGEFANDFELLAARCRDYRMQELDEVELPIYKSERVFGESIPPVDEHFYAVHRPFHPTQPMREN